jgi:hypothetical protein
MLDYSMPELPAQGTLLAPPSSSKEPMSDIPGNRHYDDLDSDSSYGDEDERPQYLNGEPIIKTGRDVSRYLIDLRDEQDPPFTLRSVYLGTVVGGLGAALSEVLYALFSSFGTRLRALTCRSITLNPL